MKKLFGMFLVLISIFVLTSCGDSDSNTITISYWVNNSNEKINNQYIFDAFMEENPGVTVKVVPISYDSYGDEIPRMHIGNTISDVFWLREDYLPIFAEKGVVKDITSLVEADTTLDTSKYFNNALDFVTYDNKLYGLPRDIGVQVMAFNLDLMGDEELPSNDWTWDDMKVLGKKLTKTSGGQITQYGLGWTDYESLVTMNSGRFYSEDSTTAQFNTPNVVESLQFYSDLSNVYHITPTPEQSQGLGNPFTGKKAAFAVVGPWDFSKLEKVGMSYDIRALPTGYDSSDSKVKLSGLGIGISTKTKKEELAYKLLKFLCYSETAQTLQAEYSIAMPSIKEIAMSETYTKSTFAPPSMDVYFDVLENGTFINNHFEGELSAKRVFEDYLYKIYNNADGNIVSAESIKDEMNTAIQKELDQ